MQHQQLDLLHSLVDLAEAKLDLAVAAHNWAYQGRRLLLWEISGACSRGSRGVVARVLALQCCKHFLDLVNAKLAMCQLLLWPRLLAFWFAPSWGRPLRAMPA